MVDYSKILLAFSVFLLFFFGCKSKNEINSNDVEIKVLKEITLSDEASNRLSMLYPTASVSKNSELIALTNFRNPIAVILIDYEGNFVEQIGSEGRGPDEYQSALFLGFDNEDNIYVRDKSLGLIKKFEREEGSVQAYDDVISQSIDITSRNMEMCDGNWYLGINKFDQSPFQKKETVGIFDDEFKLIKTFGNFDTFFEGQKSIFEDPIVVSDCQEKLIFTTHYKVPFIQVYNLENQSQVTRIDHIPPSFNLSYKFKRMVYDRQTHSDYLVNEQSMSTLLALNKKYLYHFFRNESPDFPTTLNLLSRDYYVALYSREGYNFIGEKRMGGIPLGTTKEGYIIMLTDDAPLKIQFVEIVAKN